MKYFLIILLGLISFLSPAQNVVIPAKVARYFLEQDDRAKILFTKDSINKIVITDLNLKLKVKEEKIDSYRIDSLTWDSLLVNKKEEIKELKGELSVVHKKNRIKDFKICLFTGSTVGAGVGSTLPVVGTFPGMVVGAITGSIIFIVRQFKKQDVL